MSTLLCNPNIPPSHRADRAALAFGVCALALACAAGALSSDRDQLMDVDANYMRTDQNKNNVPNLSITYLKGDVRIVQGSMKSHGDEATIYQDNTDKSAAASAASAPSAGAAPVSSENAAETPNAASSADTKNSKIKRVLLVGKPAHLQQVHDGDCGLMTATAKTIDYHADSGIAELTGDVAIVQQYHGEFHGEHMIYNTNTGEMQSGDNAPQSRVHITMEPKNEQPQAASTNNCGFATTRAVPQKPAKPAATAKHDEKH